MHVYLETQIYKHAEAAEAGYFRQVVSAFSEEPVHILHQQLVYYY